MNELLGGACMGKKYVGVDVGGTKIAAAMFDRQSEELSGEMVVPTYTQDGPDGVLLQIANLVKEVTEKAGVSLAAVGGVGVGMPATIDLEKGETLIIPNIPGDWHRKPVAKILQENLGLPIRISLMNDARLFTLAEASLGAGRGYSCVVGITLGTGIGGGIAIDGKLHLGLFGSAGEVGHHSIIFNGVPDGTGNPGAWEAYGSGPAIAAMGAKAVMQGITTKIEQLVDNDLNRITPKVIMEAAELGDPVAQGILQRAGEYIGVGMANVITIVGPHCVVLGGGVADLGDWIMKPIWESLELRCKVVPLNQLAIKRAELGGQAGVIGAALLAHQHAD
jgi:glucokinase